MFHVEALMTDAPVAEVVIPREHHEEGPGQKARAKTPPHARCRQSSLFFVSLRCAA